MTRSSEIDRQESMPNCPECEHNVFVHQGRFREWLCESCGESFGDWKYEPGREGLCADD